LLGIDAYSNRSTEVALRVNATGRNGLAETSDDSA
jgi:hypothetical protein